MPIVLLAQPGDVLSALPPVMSGSRVVPVGEVVARLRAAGLRLPSSSGDAQELVVEAVESGEWLWALGPDFEVVNLALVMGGRVLTHRLSPREVAAGFLDVGADFPGYAFQHLAASGLTAATGGLLGLFDDLVGPLDGPLGFDLPAGSYDDLGVGVGDLVGITFEAGVARLVVVAGVGDPTAVVGDLATLLAGVGPVSFDEPFDELLLASDAHFRVPLAPVTELVAAHGFALEGDLIAESVEVLDADRLAHRVDRVADEFDVGRVDAEAVVGGLWYARALQSLADPHGVPGGDLGVGGEEAAVWLAGRMADLQGALAGAPVGMLEVRRRVADPWVAFVVADRALDRDEPCPEGLELFCQVLADSPAAPPARRERAGLAYLVGRCREHDGDPLAAERHFHRALDLDGQHSYALLGLAGIAADRGQYETAASLIDRAGADQRHPLRVTVESALRDTAAPARLPGRNQVCWCGSGRKFKACHARVSTSPLPARARAVLGRALAWSTVTDPAGIRRLLGYGVLVSGGRASIDALTELVPDVLLMEGGGLADYLDRRGVLIPEDEAILAQAWLLRPRSVFEVQAVHPGAGMSLRDLMTGDQVEVVERTGSQQLHVGDLLLTRVAPVGDHNTIFGGGTLLSFGERDQVIDLLATDPGPADVIGFVARRFAPPVVVTPEGDTLESVEGTFTTTAPARLRRALDTHLTPAGEDSWQLLHGDPDQQQRVLGTLDLLGKTLTVFTLSEARYQHLIEVLDNLDVPLVEKSRELRGVGEDPGGVGGPGQQAGDSSGFLSPEQIEANPELLAQMSDYIASYERTWLEEPIPALGGMTPRAAAGDPTRRADLIALLDSFPATGSPLQMDGQRLKAALRL